MTAKATHTPGPWTVQPEDETFRDSTPIRCGEDVIAVVWPMGEGDGSADDLPESHANARLIAAAPALLALAEQVYELSKYAAASKLDNTPEFLDGLMELLEAFQPSARSVIAEARGEAQC